MTTTLLAAEKLKEENMKVIAVIAASFLLATAALAQSGPTTGATAGATCKASADKNLHGAALTSTLKKCCKDAAAGQKLHGAAESSFEKSCDKAAMGT